MWLPEQMLFGRVACLGCQKQSQFLCENGFTAAYRAYHYTLEQS
jgi:hypothetical protein